MQIIIIFLLFVAAAQSEKTENLLLEELKDEYEEYTDQDVLCSHLNVSISFSDLNLNRIKRNFVSSPLIKCLDLHLNSIVEIYPKAFDNVPNLKYLDLSNNNFNILVVLKDNLFEVETLILNDNNVYGYDLLIEGFYPKLKKLFLERITNLHSIKSAYDYNLPSLTHLHLRDNSIQNSEFNWLPESIQYLDLSRNYLSSLTLTNLTNLKKLFLDNQRQYLSDIHLENLISLKYLSVKSNHIGHIYDSTFRNITSLTHLDISDNKIKHIEVGSFNSMQNLQFLNLSNNYLEIVQVGIFDQLQNLRTLRLENNFIEMFPMVGYEINLRTLWLNCNKMQIISRDTFAKMPFLESLFLHSNELSYLHREAFRGLNNLKTLTLSNNQLSLLPSNWMLPLTSLTVLDLIGNSFKNFSDLALSEASGLKNLYLSKQLEYINAQALFAIPDNVTIDLREDIIFVKQCDKNHRSY